MKYILLILLFYSWGGLVFLVGWWFCVGFLVSFASAKILHGYTYINTEQGKKNGE